MSSIGIILAGGIGSRFGADKPKQYCKIFDKEMIWYSIDAFRQAKSIDDFIVIVDANEMQSGRLAKDYGVTLVQGGSTRNESFKNALDYINKTFPDCEKIIENNAACPMITPELIDEFMSLLDEYDYVNTAYKIHEIEYLLKQSDTHTLVMIEYCKDINYKEIIEELCPELETLEAGKPLYSKNCVTKSPTSSEVMSRFEPRRKTPVRESPS